MAFIVRDEDDRFTAVGGSGEWFFDDEARVSIEEAKLRKAREAKKVKTGRCEGRKPYGFYEGEEKLIKRIKQLHRKPRGGKRLGPYQIARILNREGWQTRKAAEWRGSHVSAILKRLSSRTS